MRVLGLFAKYWRPGGVKTRLAERIGAEQAADLQRAMLETLLARCASQGDQRVLAYFPAENKQDFACLAGDHWRLAPQSSGDLGQRMQAFFAERFSAGASQVVLIGADSPTIPLAFIDQAFALLRDRDVVFGPAEDGGYYLLGLARLIPELFHDIAWSSSQVLQQSIEALNREQHSYSKLPSWYDVDRHDDLLRLRDELLPQRAFDAAFDPLRTCLGALELDESRPPS